MISAGYTGKRCLKITAVLHFILVSFMSPAQADVPTPEPPVYTALKSYTLTTEIVASGTAAATIVAPSSGMYNGLAERIQSAVREKTGVSIPIVTDSSPEAAVPVTRNLIILGNRSTNKTVAELYNRFFTLLDLKYPGPGGSVVRTLHDPFGNGYNAIFVGGSDLAGVSRAAEKFTGIIGDSGVSSGSLTLGRIMDIELGEGVTPPADVRDMAIWEASDGYGSTGYFGWNSISKQMAMYYMTGEEHHAREFLRLAFPDEQAKSEIAEIDGERIENKDEPLSGPYHYNAHAMILFWDLIEESPVFTDEERLKVVNAFSRQISHRVGEGVYGLTSAPEGIGTRHGQWSAVSLYCLARYLQRDYPGPVWEQALNASQIYFDSLKRYAWIGGENDNLFWYNTGIAPIFTYLLLSGEREPVGNGVIAYMAHTYEILLSGRKNDFNLRYASVGFLHKAAYLLDDGRYIGYRERSNVDTDEFRLGQSFWPDDGLRVVPPDDLCGKWSMHMLTEAAWRDRKNGFALDESYYYGSYRSAPDGSGDFILMDGYNGESRNPYHTLDILQLRLDGVTVLDGYQNQVLTSADGLVEKDIAKNAALKHATVAGSTAFFSAEVPDVSFSAWQRSILHRTGKYTFVSDTMNYRSDSENMSVDILWDPENSFSQTVIKPGMVRLKSSQDAGLQYDICSSAPSETSMKDGVVLMRNNEETTAGGRRTFFTLIRKYKAGTHSLASCAQITAEAAAVSLPEPALAVAGKYRSSEGGLVLFCETHIAGMDIISAGLDTPILLSDVPLSLEWDFDSGRMAVETDQAGTLRLKTDNAAGLIMDGIAISTMKDNNGYIVIQHDAGSHIIEKLRPDSGQTANDSAALTALLENARENRDSSSDSGAVSDKQASSVSPLFSVDIGGSITDIYTVGGDGETVIYAAEGMNIHRLDPANMGRTTLQTVGTIRDIHWWKEYSLIVAGCVNEQVVAFDSAGRKQWTFVSEMDPEVFRAGKTYWFKTAPGHEGIHGLYSGTFLNGESQLFAGSACTLEIIGEDGKLVKRMPQFWGPPDTFAMIDAPDGTKNLLSARHINGTHNVGILNNASLDPSLRGFNSVPEGHTYVGGWMSLNRHHLFYEDMDSDGVKEVISEINGTWNRVTVWRADGTALYDVSFGPGDRIPAVTMLDLDIGDLDGDGQKELYAASAKGYVTALDNQCRKLWSKRLPGKPMLLKSVDRSEDTPGYLFAGLDDGTVLVFDKTGRIIAKGSLDSAPKVVTSYRTKDGTANVLFGTANGSLTAFSVADMRVGMNDSIEPEAFRLAQNHPNPFNSSTTITFSIPEETETSLKIFNVLGEEVKTLVDAKLPAGSHAVRWEPENLASGIYFYALAAGKRSSQKKLVLLK